MRLLLATLLTVTAPLLAVPVCTFQPPKGWQIMDLKGLPQEVKFFVRQNVEKGLTPSINLAVEETNLSQSGYVEAVKKMHSELNKSVSSLGQINSHCGPFELVQVDITMPWGAVKQIQAVLVQQKMAIVLTATSEADRFGAVTKELLEAIRTFDIKSVP